MTRKENRRLTRLFNQGLGKRYNTLLIDQGSEPLYLPADPYCPCHRIYFAHGFYASALHELAHWTLAGNARRQLLDYGYWYHPDGRSEAQQLAFEKVEVKPRPSSGHFIWLPGAISMSVWTTWGAQRWTVQDFSRGCSSRP